MTRPARVAFVSIVTCLLLSLFARHTMAQCVYEWRSAPEHGLLGVSHYASAVTTWDPDGPGPEQEWLIVGGDFPFAGDTRTSRIAAWDGTRWHALGSGMSGGVAALTVLNGDLVAGGSFITAGGVTVNSVARWDGTSWHPFGNGLFPSNIESSSWMGVLALTVYQGELIAAGTFDLGFPGPVNLARWDGTAWRNIGGIPGYHVRALLSDGDDLIIAGAFSSVGGVPCHRVARWDGTAWHNLGAGLPPGHAQAYALGKWNNNLVIGGYFLTPESNQYAVAYRDNEGWHPIETSINSTSIDAIYVFSVDNVENELIVAGILTAGDLVTYGASVAAWNGSRWRSFGSGLYQRPTIALSTSVNPDDDQSSTAATELSNNPISVPFDDRAGYTWARQTCVFRGDLIAVGTFFRCNEYPFMAYYVARWDGSKWVPLGSGLDYGGYQPRIKCMIEHDDLLVLGGDIHTAGSIQVSGVVGWNDEEFVAFEDQPTYETATALTHFQGQLIAAMQSRIKKWTGSNWESMNIPLPAFSVKTFCVYHDELIAGGRFGGIADQFRNIAKFDGSTWIPILTGFGFQGDEVRALTVFNGDLCAGGHFQHSGGTAGRSLNLWNGTSWSMVGTGLAGGTSNYPDVNALIVFNNELVVGGFFTTAGGIATPNIARWNGSTWLPMAGGLSGVVTALCVHDGELFAAHSGRPIISRWEGTTWTLSVDGQSSSFVNRNILALASYRGRVYAGLGGENGSLGTSTGYFSGWASIAPAGPVPTITRHPAGPSVCQNSAVTLRTIAVGDGELTYQWRKNAADLTDDEDTFGTQSSTLVITRALPADSGAYDCVVKLNHCTQAVSNPATLTVFPAGSADGNFDGMVDGRDIRAYVDALVRHGPVSAVTCAYDLSGNGVVDLTDLDDFVTRLLQD